MLSIYICVYTYIYLFKAWRRGNQSRNQRETGNTITKIRTRRNTMLRISKIEQHKPN